MADERAVAQAQPVGIDLPGQKVLSVATLGDVERIEQTVVIPPIYQYKMSRWQQPDKVSLTSEAYNYLNRVMGVQFWKPAKVNDKTGRMVANPIHEPGYIYLRLVGIWRNDLGQLMSYSEDIEVDYQLVYQDSRINARSAKPKVDEQGEVIFENGFPKMVLSPEDEHRALKALSQLRTFGIRYVQTVAKTRILKVASGVSTLPITAPQPFPIRVVGFRDSLTPDERIAQATKDMNAMFGGGETVRDDDGLTAEELAAIADFENDMTEDVERELVASRDDAPYGEDTDDDPFDAPATIKNVSPDSDNGLGLGEAEPVGGRKRRA